MEISKLEQHKNLWCKKQQQQQQQQQKKKKQYKKNKKIQLNHYN